MSLIKLVPTKPPSLRRRRLSLPLPHQHFCGSVSQQLTVNGNTTQTDGKVKLAILQDTWDSVELVREVGVITLQTIVKRAAGGVRRDTVESEGNK